MLNAHPGLKPIFTGGELMQKLTVFACLALFAGCVQQPTSSAPTTTTPTTTSVGSNNPSKSVTTPTPASPQSTTTVVLDSEESAFITLINDYRAQNGLGALQVSIALTE